MPRDIDAGTVRAVQRLAEQIITAASPRGKRARGTVTIQVLESDGTALIASLVVGRLDVRDEVFLNTVGARYFAIENDILAQVNSARRVRVRGGGA